jgi:hypothetical protein
MEPRPEPEMEMDMIIFEHWLLGVALLTLCIFIHVFGLILMSRIYFHEDVHRQRTRSVFIATLSFAFAAMAIACLHTLQAVIWAFGYLYLNALPDFHAAICFSIGALTTYASSGYVIPGNFVLLSETQAMNGVLAFGLSTAFLFTLALRLNHRNPA